MNETVRAGHVPGVHRNQRIDRKQFLTWGLSATSALALGCSGDEVDGGGTTGSGGASGSGGTFFASSGSSGSAGAGGTFSTGGASAGASGGGAAGASGAGGTVPVAPDCGSKLAVFITADHGHKLDVTVADVMAGVSKKYDTRGTSDHPHWIELTSADFSKLRAGQMVRKLSCNDGHEHEFIVNCTAVAKPETSSGITGQCDAEHLCGASDQQLCPDLTASP